MKKTILSSMIALAAISANAQVVDQQNVSLDPDLLNLLDGDAVPSILQSFTAGKSGGLTKIEFGITPSSGENETVRVKVYTGSAEGNDLSANAIAEDIVVVPGTGIIPPFAEFESLEIEEGEVYSFEITIESAFAPLFVYGTSSNYANGNFSFTTPLVTDEESDMLFRTFVTEPTALFANSEVAQFQLYPNPCSTGEIHSSKELTNVKILDQMGNQISSFDVLDKVNTSDLSAGSYVLVSDQGIQKIAIVK